MSNGGFTPDGNEISDWFDWDTLEVYGTANGGMLFYQMFIDDIGQEFIARLNSVYFYNNATGADLVDYIGVNILFDVRDDFSSGVQYTNLYAGNDQFIGNRFNDYIEAGSGNDTVIGNAGNDVLLGQVGADVISGGAGNDLINGGTGRDIMTGGAGSDRFVFRTVTETANAGSSCDVISDFARLSDKIDMVAIDAFAATARNDSFVFRGTAAFSSTTSGEIRYVLVDRAGTASDHTLVYVDNDADTATETIIRLNGLHRLTATDFIL